MKQPRMTAQLYVSTCHEKGVRNLLVALNVMNNNLTNLQIGSGHRVWDMEHFDLFLEETIHAEKALEFVAGKGTTRTGHCQEWTKRILAGLRMTRSTKLDSELSEEVQNNFLESELASFLETVEVCGVISLARSDILVNADSGRPPQPHATCPHCPHAVHGSEPCPETLGAGRGCGCQGSEGA